MTEQATLVTAAEIGRIAGVTRATVSNWRRRHEDFPAPTGGTDTSPLYDLTAVRAWLDSRGQASAASPTTELRTVLRLHPAGAEAAGRLLPLVPALAGLGDAASAEFGSLADRDLVRRAASEAAGTAKAMPGAGSVRYERGDAAAIRAAVACVAAEGGQAALDVLAERELEDTPVGGVYQTPRGLADLMASLLPEDCSGVFDPACGSGTLLAAAARRGTAELYGQDALSVQARRAAVGLLLSSPDAHVRVSVGDSLRADAFPDVTVDGVLCNPPYGDRDWGHDELAYDPRWAYGVPPRGEPELAWVEHALAHLEPGGHAVFLLPPAVAARPSGRRVRAELVRSGAVRAVIGLPVGSAVPLHIGLHVWLLQRPEPGGPERKSVLFMESAGTRRGDARGGAAERTLSPSRLRHRRESLDWGGLSAKVLTHWSRFREAPDAFEDAAGEARAVSALDLLDDVVDLTPARHVRMAPADLDPAATARRVAEHRKKLTAAAKSLVDSASYGTWRAAGDAPKEWRTATLSDLARGGAVEMLRTAPAVKDDVGEGWRAENEGRPVLKLDDVIEDAKASGNLDELAPEVGPILEENDVVVRTFPGGDGPMARLASGEDAGAVLGPLLVLLRPDPSRLDPWFLVGFLDQADNIAGASTGSTTIQVQPGRLRVPLMPLEEQRKYGAAFRRIHGLRGAARRAAEATREAADLLSAGLTTGALAPSEGDSARTATRSSSVHQT